MKFLNLIFLISFFLIEYGYGASALAELIEEIEESGLLKATGQESEDLDEEDISSNESFLWQPIAIGVAGSIIIVVISLSYCLQFQDIIEADSLESYSDSYKSYSYSYGGSYYGTDSYYGKSYDSYYDSESYTKSIKRKKSKKKKKKSSSSYSYKSSSDPQSYDYYGDAISSKKTSSQSTSYNYYDDGTSSKKTKSYTDSDTYSATESKSRSKIGSYSKSSSGSKSKSKSKSKSHSDSYFDSHSSAKSKSKSKSKSSSGKSSSKSSSGKSSSKSSSGESKSGSESVSKTGSGSQSQSKSESTSSSSKSSSSSSKSSKGRRSRMREDKATPRDNKATLLVSKQNPNNSKFDDDLSGDSIQISAWPQQRFGYRVHGQPKYKLPARIRPAGQRRSAPQSGAVEPHFPRKFQEPIQPIEITDGRRRKRTSRSRPARANKPRRPISPEFQARSQGIFARLFKNRFDDSYTMSLPTPKALESEPEPSAPLGEGFNTENYGHEEGNNEMMIV